jgi:hypothetical protein
MKTNSENMLMVSQDKEIESTPQQYVRMMQQLDTILSNFTEAQLRYGANHIKIVNQSPTEYKTL